MPEILKLLIILTAGVQGSDSSGSLSHQEKPVLAAQPEPLEAPLARPSSFTRAGIVLSIELDVATEQAWQAG